MIPIRACSWLTAVVLLVFSVTTAGADTVPQGQLPAPESASLGLSDLASLNLAGKSFNVGLAYAQTTYKGIQVNTRGRAEITDNGAPTPIIELNSGEKLLTGWNMRSGGAIIGWNIKTTAGFFNTRYQLVNSAFRGQNIGTDVSGAYLGVTPTIFLKMGPLYPGRDIYWKVGYGIGPGLLQSSGTAEFIDNLGNPIIYKVGSSRPVFALFNMASWQLQVGNWYFDIMGRWLNAHDANHSSIETYGFGVAYRFVL